MSFPLTMKAPIRAASDQDNCVEYQVLCTNHGIAEADGQGAEQSEMMLCDATEQKSVGKTLSSETQALFLFFAVTNVSLLHTAQFSVWTLLKLSS